VAKVNAAGTALVYAGYIGGSGGDAGGGIAVDGSGNAYVTGFTNSSEATFPEIVGPDLTHNSSEDAFVAKISQTGGCPPHTIHGHLPGPVDHPAGHSFGSHASHEHHGQHGHIVQSGCPPHAPGHSAGFRAETGELFNHEGVGGQVVGAINEDGSPNGNWPGIAQAGALLGPARRGSVVQLFAAAKGLSGEPEVYIGGARAKVLFSGPAPGLTGGWQINALVPEDAPQAPAVHVKVVFGGFELPSIDVAIE